MLVLAMDTCDARGSVAVLRDGVVLAVESHEVEEDYSSWLLPAVQRALGGSRFELNAVELFAAVTGPGSFTGVRVGLSAMKAWSEVFGRPMVGVSRLEVLAAQSGVDTGWVAAVADGSRGEVYGGLYRKGGGAWELIESETVATPAWIAEWVRGKVNGEKVTWVAAENSEVGTEATWDSLIGANERMMRVTSVLAPVVGELGLAKMRAGMATDALRVDANYIRRPDAENLWKKVAK